MAGTLNLAKSARAEFLNRTLVGAHRLPQYDRHRDILAQLRMRYCETHTLGDARMIHQHLVNLARRDLLAATINNLLQPSGNGEIAVGIDYPLVTGAEKIPRW